jgi:PilZ domain
MTIETTATLPPSPEQASGCSCAAPANWTDNERPHGEQRRETRYETCEPVDVYLLDANNLRLSGMLRDISKNGMRIELDMPLKGGDRLEVVLRNRIIVFAEVRYSRRTGESYQIGSVIDDVYYPKAEVPARASETAARETTFKQVTQLVCVGEKRSTDSPEEPAQGRPSKGVSHQVVGFPHPVKTARPGVHLDRYDVDNLLKLRLSETRTTLLERHLASCDQCLDLVLRALEERASPHSALPKNEPGQS